MKKGKTDIFAEQMQKDSIEELKIRDYLFGAAVTLGGLVAGVGAIFSGPIIGGATGAVCSFFKDSNFYEYMAVGAGIGTCLELMAIPFLMINSHQKMYHADEL